MRMKRAILPLLAILPLAVAAAERKPNFLFVYTDDQRWDAMSVVQREQGERARFPWFQTPNMDRLAAEGVRVVYLGAEVPADELARVVRELGAAAVAVSVSSASDRDAVTRDLTRLREALPASVATLVGGAGSPRELEGTAAVSGFADLARWARELRPAAPGRRRAGRAR